MRRLQRQAVRKGGPGALPTIPAGMNDGYKSLMEDDDLFRTTLTLLLFSTDVAAFVDLFFLEGRGELGPYVRCGSAQTLLLSLCVYVFICACCTPPPSFGLPNAIPTPVARVPVERSTHLYPFSWFVPCACFIVFRCRALDHDPRAPR